MEKVAQLKLKEDSTLQRNQRKTRHGLKALAAIVLWVQFGRLKEGQGHGFNDMKSKLRRSVHLF